MNFSKETSQFEIRLAKEQEFTVIGELLVRVYSSLEGFPKMSEQPSYYDMLLNVGRLTENPDMELLVAVTSQHKLAGVVVFVKDMKSYGSGGVATQVPNACGFRLLGVDPDYRGMGLGKQLTQYCIDKAKGSACDSLIIHTTQSMKQAWKMYEKLGFLRAQDLDFMQGVLPVFGFRLNLR